MSQSEKVLTQALTTIQNPYLDELKDWPTEPDFQGGVEYDSYPVPRDKDGNKDFMAVRGQEIRGREAMVKQYSWAIPSQEAIDTILVALDGRPMVEIGAGTGYWAWLLSQCGVDVAAYDTNPPRMGHNSYHGSRTKVVRAPTDKERLDILKRWDALASLTDLAKEINETPGVTPFNPPPLEPPDIGVQEFHDTDGTPHHEWFPPTVGNEFVLTLPENEGRVLFLCWPPYDDDMADVALGLYSGDTLIYVGEGDGGCTGDDAFHKRLWMEWDEEQDVRLPQWFGIHDWLTIFQRREVPRTEDEYEKRYE